MLTGVLPTGYSGGMDVAIKNKLATQNTSPATSEFVAASNYNFSKAGSPCTAPLAQRQRCRAHLHPHTGDETMTTERSAEAGKVFELQETLEQALKDALAEAIERSVSHDEVARVTVDGDSGDVLVALDAIWPHEVDYRMCDHEGVDTMDVWGWTEDTPDDQQEWRLEVRFEDGR